MSCCGPVKSPNDEKLYRVVPLSNGLRALLISDQQSEAQNGLDAKFSQNKKHSTSAEAAGSCGTQEQLPPQRAGVNDAGILQSDDSDSSWTDMSSDDDQSDLSDEDAAASDSADSCGCSDRRGISGKRRSQRSHSPSSHLACSGEKLSAAGLCVGIGSFCDPTEIPGLAHFLEHMVFMGSQKYPNDNDFDVYVSEHGGSSNAFTDCEQTVFHFDIQRKYFYSALDRFAQFFIEPLMKKDSVDRELEAIDSEFRLSLTSDKNRIEQLLGSLANKCHPLSKFMWGNMASLKHCPQSSKIDIYKTLQQFRLKYYLPQYMTLVVQSQDSLDQLESWVKELFCAVPRREASCVTFQHLPAPFAGEQFTRLFRVVPVKTLNQLLITWPLPSQIQNYRVKPLHYLGWLVGYEGKGSLAAYLKHRHWAVDVESGNGESGMEHNSTCSLFSVIITLTDEGLDHLYPVIEAVFQFLSILRCAGPQKYIYDEIRTIEENEFRFQEPGDPQDNVEQLCVDMQHFAVAHYITGSQLMLEYSEEVIDYCTQLLTADRANVMVLSKRHAEPGFCNRREKWFKTPYKVEDIPEDWMKKWSRPDGNPHLHLPEPNPYIACEFEIKPADRDDCSKHPVVICESSVCRLWYKKDVKFKVPRAYVCLYLRVPMVSRSARNMCLTDLYVKLLNHNIALVTYDAEIAGLSNEVKVFDDGVVLKLGGFNHKLPLLLRAVVDYIADLAVSKEDFDVVKHDLSTMYINQSLKPHKLNQDVRLSLLLRNRWLMKEKYAELSCISCESLAQFAKDFFKRAFVEGLIQGNITAKEALDLQNYVVTKLQLRPLCSASTCDIAVSQLPSDSVNVFRVKNRNADDDNCVITNYYQHGPCNVDHYVMMEMLMAFMEEPCFDWLRTRKQLGYYVDSGIRCTHGILGYSITVNSHSSKFSMKYLDEEIESFLRDMVQRIAKMKLRRFQHLVKSRVKQKCIEDTSLAEEVDRNWSEVMEQNYLFDRTDREIDSLNKVTMEDFKLWAQQHLHSGSDNYRKLSVQVVGNKSAKAPKKNCIHSAHHKKRTSKTKMASAAVTDCVKSKTPAGKDAGRRKSKASANVAAEAAGSEAAAVNCTATTKSEANAQNSTGAVDAPANNGAVEDNSSQVSNALPQSSALPARKPNVIFIDSINSFRYSSVWYPPSKVLP